MLNKTFTAVLLAATISGCSIKQSVDTAEIDRGATLCVIENTEVRDGFLNSMKSALTAKGVRYQVVNSDAVPAECFWTASYTARWSWDLALYMSFAEIQIYKDGVLQGEALYDSTLGGANMSKFIDADTKIKELVGSLLNVKTAALFNLNRFFG
jgi:hypothetical protein